MILNLQEVLNVPCLIPMYKNVGLHPNSDNQVTDFFIYLNSSLDGLQRIVIAFIIVVLVISLTLGHVLFLEISLILVLPLASFDL